MKIRLQLLRLAARLVCHTQRSNAAYAWLGHYLAGSGETMLVPTPVYEESLPLMLRLAFTKRQSSFSYEPFHHRVDRKTVVVRFENTPEAFNSYGFRDKPTLFYLVGGFEFKLTFLRGGAVRIQGTDRYDWHPTDPRGGWSVSPFPVRLWGWVGSIMRWIHPAFSATGVSDQLWFDMLSVGAAEFDTKIDIVLDRTAVRRYKRRGQNMRWIR